MKLKIDTQFLLDLCVSAFFALFSMKILTLIFPLGVTRSFLVGGYKAVGIVFVTFGIIFIISWFYNKDFKFKKKIELPKLKDFLLLALPMSPVINYALINSEYLLPSGYIYLFGITLAFVLFLSFILPVIFSYYASYNILMISGLALSFTILSMPRIYIGYYLLGDRFFTQGMYLIFSFAVVYLLYLYDKRLTYLTLIFFMFINLVFNFSTHSSNGSAKVQKSERLIKFLNNQNNKIINKKNVYILSYESYSNLETHNHYGFDNSNQIDFLEKLGFKVYHGIYSAASASEGSLSKTLDINADLYPPYDGPRTPMFRPYLSGNSFSTDIFKSNGYKTIGLYYHGHFWSKPIGWDKHHPEEDARGKGGKIITDSIFEGNFRHDIFSDYSSYDDYLKLKRKYLTSGEKNTLFFTHNKYPDHSQNSNRCLPNEKEIYSEGLKKANIEMKDDVLNIMNNDPNSIIVLTGDHGPYLTKNCMWLEDFYEASEIDKYDIQDRYGAFLSIYWPKDISDFENNIVMTQDIFPAILSRITNNSNLFNELKVERELAWDWEINKTISGVNVNNGIIIGGKDDGKPLFDTRSYNLTN
tara:strand:+ start:735 stop:2486 length:1752 start_codon:yes stop_codon:yes gene_type:complete